ncbi:hypothetical protein OROGR_016202 [Orobanche gracilis]
MDPVHAPNMGISNTGQRMLDCNTAQMDDYRKNVDELFTTVDKIEQKVNEVKQFFLNLREPNTSKSASILKDKEKEKHIPSMKKVQQDASRREAAVAKRMQELMRQFGTIFRQMTQHKWAWPFMQPVDVEGLGLHDYYQIIDRPMDFSIINNQMETKDGIGYKHVCEIRSDVRLVFKNAMKYNDGKSDVHVMARSLLEKFEEKWLQFLRKVTEEEIIREEEESEAQMNMQLAHEAAHVKLARDIGNELYDIDLHIEELREMVVSKCRMDHIFGHLNGGSTSFNQDIVRCPFLRNINEPTNLSFSTATIFPMPVTSLLLGLSSSKRDNESQHEVTRDEWLQNGNCAISKSYRAVSNVLPLVAKALEPPPGMKFRCPPAMVAARAALAKTAFTRNLRPQPLPSKILVIGILGMAANKLLGIWRKHGQILVSLVCRGPCGRAFYNYD